MSTDPHLPQVVWLKRDLRLDDHEPLLLACRSGGPVLVLYIVEPALLQAPESDRGYWRFVWDALRELDQGLRARGARLTIRHGEATAVFAALDDSLRSLGGIGRVLSHQETGNAITFARDRAVDRWLRQRGIPWQEATQDGVIRRLDDRDGWARRWQQRMQQPLLPAPDRIRAVPESLVPAADLPDLDDLALPPSTILQPQRGGATAAHDLLQSFLEHRGRDYQREMSSPRTAFQACSRLSPHFAQGTISLRTVHQALAARSQELRDLPRTERGNFLVSLRSFAGRLRWHCHFMQKLEDEPAIEFHNMHRGYDGLREGEFDEARFLAWCEGRTGFPMVDACMRCLRHQGWINFRMRAMLVSFAAYHLWLHWRPLGLHLARCFVDFEPGIHWSQVQMQSGTTGINTVRIYSPAKQLKDHDPDGAFVRHWVPELQHVPVAHLAEPHRMTLAEQQACGFRPGTDYPLPLVDAKAAVAAAKQRIYALRRTADARQESQRVYAQHGSRKRPATRARRQG